MRKVSRSNYASLKEKSVRVHRGYRIKVITRTLSDTSRSTFMNNEASFNYPNHCLVVSHLDQLLPEGIESGYKEEVVNYLDDLFKDPLVDHAEFFPSYSMVISYTTGGTTTYPLYWYAWTLEGYNYMKEAMKKEKLRNDFASDFIGRNNSRAY